MANKHEIPSAPGRAVPMRVIVCGLHRTGTSSMRLALRQLGFHDCYHMATVFENLHDHPQQWVRAYEAKYLGKGSFDKGDWDRLLGYSQACCDVPAALFSCELAQLYPDAKVVILNRDPEKWYDSVSATVNKALRPTGFFNVLQRIYIYLLDPGMRNWVRFTKVMGMLGMPFDHANEHDKAVAWFNERYAEFRARIPAERRIEFSVKDGWAPLCEHLDVPVPQVRDEQTGQLVEAPFPHANDRASFIARSERNLAAAVQRCNANLIDFLGRACLVGCLGYGGFLVGDVPRRSSLRRERLRHCMCRVVSITSHLMSLPPWLLLQGGRALEAVRL
ncbi:hypothetical protein JDV02_003334 [Purpureocillium takamizusanense]|uniref:NAD dependent epimerase/dehydratase n=1 Tax=Purpureocillium takamizusanense TaxID=2060973 RepID=A0A9Q8V9M8_9HYPO|nr:uncharacterized protein JDV02_003334 [Purpureocillium takamizusanense]UNI16952.1 hypothetical protein JDV02_003334 [Purpureocillium takamizusanense]